MRNLFNKEYCWGEVVDNKEKGAVSTLENHTPRTILSSQVQVAKSSYLYWQNAIKEHGRRPFFGTMDSKEQKKKTGLGKNKK